jgi:hypothetical protein
LGTGTSISDRKDRQPAQPGKQLTRRLTADTLDESNVTSGRSARRAEASHRHGVTIDTLTGSCLIESPAERVYADDAKLERLGGARPDGWWPGDVPREARQEGGLHSCFGRLRQNRVRRQHHRCREETG